MPSEFSTMSRVRSALAVMPSTQLTRRLSTACSIVAIDVNSANVMTGSITFSCSWPADAASVTVRSSPITRKLGLVHDLGNHRIHLARHDRRAGLHLRQMDLVQAAARPEASMRMSLQIFVSLLDVRFSTPDSST